jgi:hypothetical protein
VEAKELGQSLLLERQSLSAQLAQAKHDAKQWQQAASKSCHIAEQAQKAQAKAHVVRTKAEEERTTFRNVEGARSKELSDLKTSYAVLCGRLSAYEAEVVGPLTGYMDQGAQRERDPAAFARYGQHASEDTLRHLATPDVPALARALQVL